MTMPPLVKVERDPQFRLTEGERQRLRPRFDLDALETLLAHVPPEHREGILEAFRMPQGNEVQELWYIGDADLQEMLEEVWAPMWERRTLAEIEADETERPGKRLAIARKRTDPDPPHVVLAALDALDDERWDELSRWMDAASAITGDDGVAVLRGRARTVQRRRTVVNVAAEGDDLAHVLYREQERLADGTWDAGTVRVSTVRRTPDGWRLHLTDLIAQTAR